MLDWVGTNSLLYWPELPETIEPNVTKDRSVDKWQAALRRDAYRYGNFLLDTPEAWMVYRATLEWHHESKCSPEDFRDLEDPEGTVSIKGAELLCHEQRMATKRKLAWLGEFIARKVASKDVEFLENLARIPKLLPAGDPPPPEQDPDTGAWRESIWADARQSSFSQQANVMNAIFCLAGRFGPKAPTCRAIHRFLEAEKVQITESDIRFIAKQYGVRLAKDKVGRPVKPKSKKQGGKRPPSVP